MASKIFKESRELVPNYSRIFVKKSFSVVEYIHDILNKKQMTQKDLAGKLNKTESEISKILTPGHNMTFKTVSKIEDALNEEIITTPKEKRQHQNPVVVVFNFPKVEKRKKSKKILEEKQVDTLHSKKHYEEFMC